MMLLKRTYSILSISIDDGVLWGAAFLISLVVTYGMEK